MARTAGAKVVFVPMNLSGMGAAGMDGVSQQIAASARDGEDGNVSIAGPSGQAGMLTSISNV